MTTPTAVSNKNSVTSQLEFHIDLLSNLIEKHFINTGDCEDDSQKVCLTNRLNALQISVNGIENNDLVKDSFL